MLLAAGHVRDGWMYLRPVGDKRAAAALIAKIEPDEDNMEELVDVCLREGVDVARGFQLVLDNYGTCKRNAEQLAALQDYIAKVKAAVDKANKNPVEVKMK